MFFSSIYLIRSKFSIEYCSMALAANKSPPKSVFLINLRMPFAVGLRSTN